MASKREKIQRRALRIYTRDNWTCQLCRLPIDPDLLGTDAHLAPSIDHRHPRALGGGNEASNLQAAHRCCNVMKGAEPGDAEVAA